MGSALLLAKPKPKINLNNEDFELGYFGAHHEQSIQSQVKNYFILNPQYYYLIRFIPSTNGYLVGAEAVIIDEFDQELYKATAEADDPFMAEREALIMLLSVMTA